MEELPCKDFNCKLEDFSLENSPCRKCSLDVCPFDVYLDRLDKSLVNLYEFLGMERFNNET